MKGESFKIMVHYSENGDLDPMGNDERLAELNSETYICMEEISSGTSFETPILTGNLIIHLMRMYLFNFIK